MAESKGKYTYAIGRRKTSVAQVRLFSGKGESTINGMPIEEKFTLKSQMASLNSPFVVTDNVGNYYFEAIVKGGGTTGQLEATRHGITRALIKINEELKPALKVAGLVIRDPRMKERKKIYLRGARRAKQFSKR